MHSVLALGVARVGVEDERDDEAVQAEDLGEDYGSAARRCDDALSMSTMPTKTRG